MQIPRMTKIILIKNQEEGFYLHDFRIYCEANNNQNTNDLTVS